MCIIIHPSIKDEPWLAKEMTAELSMPESLDFYDFFHTYSDKLATTHLINCILLYSSTWLEVIVLL